MVSLYSDKGIIRKYNEDYADYYIADKFELYIVADGMGGHNAGDVASKCAVESIKEFIIDNFYEYKDRRILLQNSIKYANTIIYSKAVKNKELRGMGTTVVAILKTEDFIQIANVGDSCAYGVKDGFIYKISIDHSLVQELINGGSISEEEARSHPKKNIITRAVGTSNEVSVDIFNVDINNYEGFLLCSDGLTNELSKEEVENVLINNEIKADTSKILVDLAKYKGGKDNITALLFGGGV